MPFDFAQTEQMLTDVSDILTTCYGNDVNNKRIWKVKLKCCRLVDKLKMKTVHPFLKKGVVL